MTNWIVKNSFQRTIFDKDLSIIESWNDILFLYSKIINDKELYKKNYFFFVSSINSPFSKEEILECLDFVFDILSTEDFIKSLTKDDKQNFTQLFLEIKSSVLKDIGDIFFTSLNEL